MASPRVLISGSGIAGGVFAHWLLKAMPLAQITMVERFPSFRNTGSAVDIRNSAVDIIKWMGAEEEIRRHFTTEKGISLVRVDGSVVGTLHSSGRSDVQTITSEYEIFRGELARIFLDPSRDKIKLMFDDYVERYSYDDDDDNGQVTVTFAKSQRREKYDLLVAADGFGSRIRGQLLDTNPRDQIHDEGVHAAYFTLKQDLLKGSNLAQGYSATGGRVVFIRPDPHPDGRCRVLLMKVTWANDTATKAKFNKAIEAGNEDCMALLEDHFADVGWLGPQVLKGMRESDDFYCSLFAQVRSPRLSDGRRVVLLGDAGYATPGIGTSLAIMGGYILAGELLNSSRAGHATGDLDYAAAFARYSESIHPFAKSQQGNDCAMQILNPQTWWALKLRNAAIGLFIGRLRVDRLILAAGSWLGFTDKKLSLPDYPWPDQ